MNSKLKTQNSKLNTLCVHAGAEPDSLTGAVSPPIYLTSTYAQRVPGKHKGYEYSRTKNPTRDRLERALAELEGVGFASAFASGLAAEDAVLRLLNPGDETLVCRDLYGGTFRLMRRVWQNYGLKFHFLDTTQVANVTGRITSKTKLIWVETPSNPLLSVTDIAVLAKEIHRKAPQALLCVDNTFATPVLQRPAALGADLVVHSMTKYLGGHSDILGGAVATPSAQINEKIKFFQNAAGAVPSPLDCFLVLRGIRTLVVRMKTHCDNAAKTAWFLAGHPAVGRVFYPGFEDHPGHAVAKKQMSMFGGMVSFQIKGGRASAERFFSRLKIFTVGESLGGVESLACYPWVMTHASIPEKERLAAGVTDGLIRLSVGIEGVDDLTADLQNALGPAKTLRPGRPVKMVKSL
ncbi:MAG: PLP-dependent transferase [Elusimicrobia bacterium]|nr:PLP-dependent transferase [Elusimicrobiota bacterium]